jgi:hypothetical protein
MGNPLCRQQAPAGHAPEGSGVPVGTAYHWYIVAHQNVTKLNANDYSTSMTGFKYKLAHKRADTDKWSASDRAQRKRLIAFLKDLIRDLENQATEEANHDSQAQNGAVRHARSRATA